MQSDRMLTESNMFKPCCVLLGAILVSLGTVSGVLFRKRELTEFCGKLGGFCEKLGELFALAHIG